MGGRPGKTLLKSLLGLPARLQKQYNVKNPACQYKCAVLAQIFLTAREMAQAPPPKSQGQSPKSKVQVLALGTQFWALGSWPLAPGLWALGFWLWPLGSWLLGSCPQSSSTIKAWSDAPLGRTYNQLPGHCEGKPPFSKRVLASPWVERSPDLITMARSS